MRVAARWTVSIASIVCICWLFNTVLYRAIETEEEAREIITELEPSVYPDDLEIPSTGLIGEFMITKARANDPYWKSRLVPEPITVDQDPALQQLLANTDEEYERRRREIERNIQKRMREFEEEKLTLCSRLQYDKPALYIFNEIKTTWCPVFKSGSTQWKNYFLRKYYHNATSNNLNNLSGRRLRLDRVHREEYYAAEHAGNIRFTVVRHPLSRLISHVNNAAKDMEMVAMRTDWVEEVMYDARKDRIPAELTGAYEEEFKGYFEWLKIGRKGDFSISEGNPLLNPPYPTLPEFIDMLIRKRKRDGHWTPATEYCDFCRTRFDFILRLEESPMELWYLLEKLGLWDDRVQFLSKPNTSGKRKLSEGEVRERALDELDNSQRGWVNEWFRDDFTLLHYDRLPLLKHGL